MILEISLSDNIIENDLFSMALQEIDIIFTTVNTELIGYPHYGCDFNDYLWMLTPAVNSLYTYINEKFTNSFYISRLKYNININYSQNKETHEAIYHVLITLYDDNYSAQKEITLGR